MLLNILGMWVSNCDNLSINNLLIIYKFKSIYIHLFISLFMLQESKVNLPKSPHCRWKLLQNCSKASLLNCGTIMFVSDRNR